MPTIQLFGNANLQLGQPAAPLQCTSLELEAFVLRQVPPGEYFSREDGWWVKTARGIARFLSRFVKRRRAFERQMDPRTAEELLPEWESAYAIPTDTSIPLDDRRATVLTKVRSLGGVNVTYYEGLADSFGYPDAVVTAAADPFTTVSLADDFLAGGEWKLTMRLTAASQGAVRDALLEELISSQLLAGYFAIFEFT